MKCIIVEDQPPAQRILKKYIADYGRLELLATFADPLLALEYLAANSVDLMFLDINLPKLSGMELLRSLRRPVKVILTTAYSEYALESYDLDVVDYLLKPFSFARFVRAVNKAQPGTKEVEKESSYPEELFVKSGYEHHRIATGDIIYIHAEADYTELVMIKGAKFLSTESLRHWTETLDPNCFAQVHRSYVVNTDYLSRVSRSKIYLKEVEKPVPLGRVYKEEFMRRFVG